MCSNGRMTSADTELATRLDEIAEFEQSVHSTLMTRVFRRLGPTKGFIALYRRLGPKVDPWVMRSRGGRTMTRLYGLPGLLLDTTGVKSGLVRTSPLLYVRDGDDFAVVGTNFGQFTHPAWTANLLAHPRADIEVSQVRVAVEAELVDQAGWDRNWPRFCAVYAGYARYLETCGDRVPRMFLLHPRA